VKEVIHTSLTRQTILNQTRDPSLRKETQAWVFFQEQLCITAVEMSQKKRFTSPLMTVRGKAPIFRGQTFSPLKGVYLSLRSHLQPHVQGRI